MEYGYEYSLGQVLVDVRQLNDSYGDGTPVLRDINMQVRKINRPGKTSGQIEALLAPSGMGKTTLFRSIAGLRSPKAGGVYLEGCPTAVRIGQVGVVAQDYPLFEHMTVINNLTTAAKRKQGSEAKALEASNSMLQRFGLDAVRNHYPHELSGGQRQRIAIMQQMLCSGHLLLMDEPFSGLDIIAKDEVSRLITDVADQDELNSIIVTTHDIAAAVAVADTIWLLGRERDPATGAFIPGATIRECINVIDRGLTWHPNITEMPQFFTLVKEIQTKFREL